MIKKLSHIGSKMFIWLLISVSLGLSQSVWKESGFEDFRDGWFFDAGSNLYVSKEGNLQMITRWDLNGDGFLDIVLAGSHGHTEKENTYIYLNNGTDIDERSLIQIPGGGSRDGILEDFNQDGYADIAVANYADSHFRNVNAWIYYGSPNGFSPQNRTELPAYLGTSVAAGDFNNDSWVDIAIACQWYPEGRSSSDSTASLIYWNSPEGFSKDKHLPLSFHKKGARAVASADLDYDGIADVIALAGNETILFYSGHHALQNADRRITLQLKGNALATGNFNRDKYKDIAIASGNSVVILIGAEDGYDVNRSVRLPARSASDVTFSDVDVDGLEDVIVANSHGEDGATWIDSYVYYSDGRDFSSREPVKLPTLAASGVSAGDLNNDGYPEIVLCNERVTNEQSLLSYVYWNNKGTFRFGDHTQLSTQGALSCAVGDVNNDGLKDVLFFNDEGGFRDGPTTTNIYWGDGTRNYSIERQTVLPTHQIFGYGTADLDDDGHVDLILAQAKFIAHVEHSQGGLIIYWGGESGLSGKQTHLSMTSGYGGVRIADINRDGYLDIMAGGDCIDLQKPDLHGFPIFWGSPEGFKHQNRSILHFEKYRIRGPLLMDLNKDGWLDIAGQVEDGKIKIWWGNENGFADDNFREIDLGRKDHLMYIKAADLNKDGWLDLLLPHRASPDGTANTSLIYYGSAAGFNNDNRIEIESYVPYQNTIADLNKDGWLDIFLTSYGGEVSGNRPSLIYWGSQDGFDQKPRTELPSYGSSGSLAADFDRDGWPDVLVCNHRQAGSYAEPLPHRHTCNSMLYWGSPQGFSPDNRWEMLAPGPSGFNLRDVGNSYDRGLYEDYISSPYKIPANERPSQISWKADTPHGTVVHAQLRMAEDQQKLSDSAWEGPQGKDSWYTDSGSEIRESRGRWIQYRLRLMTPDGADTPAVREVQVTFQ
jgi:hypothetical protein